jgi:hypothetical protein
MGTEIDDHPANTQLTAGGSSAGPTGSGEVLKARVSFPWTLPSLEAPWLEGRSGSSSQEASRLLVPNWLARVNVALLRPLAERSRGFLER